MTEVALPAELEPGSLVDEYRIEAIAGRGGMGVVYRATEERLGRPVALKVIAPGLADDEAFRERFVREAALAGGIDHPNVVPVYAAGEVDGRLFIAMRWVDGDDLRALVERDGPLNPARAVEVVAAVAAALDAAHHRGLVHRDVKPANILVGEHVYLGDFGLARAAAQDRERGVTKTGQFVGTVEYIAPEQVLGRPATPATDVYTLGCVLFFALTGRHPFGVRSEYEMMTAHLEEGAPRITDTVPSAPAALDAVVARALEKAPEDRFASAGDLAVAARSALSSSPSAIAAPQPAPKRRRRRREAPMEQPRSSGGPRRRGRVIAVACVATVAAGAGAFFVTSGGEGDGDAEIRQAPDRQSAVAAQSRAAAPIASIPVGEGPEGIAAEGDAVWVTDSRANSLVRVDARSNALIGGRAAGRRRS